MRSPHQTIHTKTIPKLALPAAVPMMPAAMASKKPTKARDIRIQFNARCWRMLRNQRQRVNSRRGSLGRGFGVYQHAHADASRESLRPARRNATVPIAARIVTPIARQKGEFGVTTSSPSMNGCNVPHTLEHRSRNFPGRSATKVARLVDPAPRPDPPRTRPRRGRASHPPPPGPASPAPLVRRERRRGYRCIVGPGCGRLAPRHERTNPGHGVMSIRRPRREEAARMMDRERNIASALMFTDRHATAAQRTPRGAHAGGRRALPTTETELRDMAAAAMIGLSKIPKNGYSTPAATARRPRCTRRRRRGSAGCCAWSRPTAAAPARSPQIALEQGHACALHGHIRAGPHGDADIGGGQGRRIVDAVPRHGDDATLGLQSLTTFPLSSGRISASTSAMPSLRGDGLCGRPVVAGQHDDADPVLLQGADGVRRAGLDRVGDGEEPGKRPSTAARMTVAPSPGAPRHLRQRAPGRSRGPRAASHSRAPRAARPPSPSPPCRWAHRSPAPPRA